MTGITKRRSKQPKFVPGEVADDDDDVWPRNSAKRGPGCCKEPADKDDDEGSEDEVNDDEEEEEDEDLDQKERKAQAGQRKRAQQKEKSGIRWMPIFFLLLVTGPAIFAAVDWLLNLPMFKSSTPRPPRRLDPRSCLVKFYKEINPQKLGEVDKILSKYQGKERELFKNLQRQYDMRIDCIER